MGKLFASPEKRMPSLPQLRKPAAVGTRGIFAGSAPLIADEADGISAKHWNSFYPR